MPLGAWSGREAFLTAWHAHLWHVSVLFRAPLYLAGLAGVYLLYRVAERLAGPRAAWMAALILAVAPPFADVPRINLVDIAATSLALAALVLAFRVVDGRDGLSTWLALGVCLGTAANYKIPYVLFWIVLPAAALATTTLDAITEDKTLHRPRALALLCGVAGAGAFLASWPWRVAPELAAAYPDGAKAFLFLKKNLGALGVGLMGVSAISVIFPVIRALVNFFARCPSVRIPAITGAVTFLAWSPFYLADPAITLHGLMVVGRAVDPESVGLKPITWHAVIVQRSSVELVGPLFGVLGLAGIAHALVRGGALNRVALTIPAIWFAYTGFASYSKLSPKYVFIPLLALHAARLLAALPAPAGLALLSLGLALPLNTNLQRSRDLLAAPRADTRQELAAWYRAKFPDGEPLALDPNLLLLDAANPGIYQVPLPRRKVDEIRAKGVRYVVTNSRTRSDFAIPDEQQAAFESALRASGTKLQSWTPGPDRTGPTVEVRELR